MIIRDESTLQLVHFLLLGLFRNSWFTFIYFFFLLFGIVQQFFHFAPDPSARKGTEQTGRNQVQEGWLGRIKVKHDEERCCQPQDVGNETGCKVRLWKTRVDINVCNGHLRTVRIESQQQGQEEPWNDNVPQSQQRQVELSTFFIDLQTTPWKENLDGAIQVLGYRDLLFIQRKKNK